MEEFFNQTHSKEVFLVMGKQPIKGFSKTRLANDLGDDLALELYEAFINDFFSKLSNFNGRIYFFGTPRSSATEDYFAKIARKNGIKKFIYHHQKDIPFFSRIEEMFNLIHEREGECRIHLTGTDIPDFPMDVLSNKEISIGPDEDGGFYYLSGPSSASKIFQIDVQVKDGSNSVMSILSNKITELGYKSNTLCTWSDIDNLKDLHSAISRSGDKMPQTFSIYKSQIAP